MNIESFVCHRFSSPEKRENLERIKGIDSWIDIIAEAYVSI